MNPTTYPMTQIDLESLIAPYKIPNTEYFLQYLKEIWIDLSQRTNDKKLIGVNRVTFASYYNLPGIISDRLFSVLDANKSGFLEGPEFVNGMNILFNGDFDSTSQFIFDFYDFDKDGKISREDIRTVLSYVSWSKEVQQYRDRVNSQEELFTILEQCFQGNIIDFWRYSSFKNVIESKNSDVYWMILLFLYEKKPFTKLGLSAYAKQKSPSNSPSKATKASPISKTSPKKLVASPTKTASFSSYKYIFSRTDNKRKATMTQEYSELNKKVLNSPTSPNAIRSEIKWYTVHGKENSEVIKLQPFGQSNTTAVDTTGKDPNYMPICRKPKQNLKDLNNMNSNHSKINNSGKYKDLKLQPAFKQEQTPTNPWEESNSNSIFSNPTLSPEKMTEEFEFSSDNEEDEETSEQDESIITHEGYLIKYVDHKLKRVWFKLIDKDWYFFKNNKTELHKGMHNLSGVFIREEEYKIISGTKYYCFSMIYPKKTRVYYLENHDEYKEWISKLNTVTGFTNWTDIYDIGEKIGNGKFGLIKIGTNKKTGDKVAIKIMSKEDMDDNDLELARTEIEILKICQHPNIIKLLEVFENIDYFYIIMEYCSGGDWFSYLEKRHFRLPEEQVSRLMHKMCAAVYYINSYGITHRDLKPENVWMTSSDDNADIRILDFGLSKIIGPDEKCKEPYGTLSYVAPEVLLDEPYGKEVDLWSLGVMSYLMLSGSLPFNSRESEEEIARKTVKEQPQYNGTQWKRISNEARNFVVRLLEKQPNKRLTIKEALEHEWFRKWGFDDMIKARKRSKDFKWSTFEVYSSVNDNNFNPNPKHVK